MTDRVKAIIITDIHIHYLDEIITLLVSMGKNKEALYLINRKLKYYEEEY